MQIFIDSADATELKALAETGLVDALRRTRHLLRKRVAISLRRCAIFALFQGQSALRLSKDHETMIKEGLKLRGVAPNIVVKAADADGLKACKYLEDNGHPVNVTLCFSAVQALMAAKAGATSISPIGRLDDNGQDGMELIREIRAIFDNYDYPTSILAASTRTAGHVREAAIVGADCATI